MKSWKTIKVETGRLASWQNGKREGWRAINL
jgi:hypothetical protein